MSFRCILAVLLLTSVLGPARAVAFCGFYVAKADTKLYNQASKVVLVRDGDRTVLTMSNDYEGPLEEFALVIPVPTVLRREQVHVTKPALISHLDAYTAPRLVEYHDENPCDRRLYEMAMSSSAGAPQTLKKGRSRADLGVKVEDEYTVGEYDIVILSATQSDGLATWLQENGYRIPEGASVILSGYVKQKTNFFVAKVNLKEQSALGFQYLRPIQVAFESPKFMLPIRLGMVNARGPQELFVFAVTRKGRVETTNYRTIKLPSELDVPLYIKSDFDNFYRAMFDEQVRKERMGGVFLEYAWDMAWCDLCAAEPLTPAELKELGVMWLGEERQERRKGGFIPPGMPGQQPVDAFVTRLHLRYDGEHFPDDLAFQQTADRTNFQGRYILRHPYTGEADCKEAEDYRKVELPRRAEMQAKNLAAMTGWNVTDIKKKMGEQSFRPQELENPKASGTPWWKGLWNDK